MKALGRGIKVAVIDSGVNQNHPHVNGVAGGVAIGSEDSIDTYVDFLGHGTAVLAAIKEKAPEAQFYAVKIYYRSLRANILLLTQAIDWAVCKHVDLINLSLGTRNEAHRDAIATAINSARKEGIEVVAPAPANDNAKLPENLKGVTYVGVDWSCARDRFRKNRASTGLQWLASGYPRTLPGIAPEVNIKGVSFAVANMAGFVAKACELRSKGTGASVEEILACEAEDA